MDNIGGSLKCGECFGKCELENTFACNVWCANILKHNISTHVHSELSPQLPLSVITFAMFCDVVYSVARCFTFGPFNSDEYRGTVNSFSK